MNSHWAPTAWHPLSGLRSSPCFNGSQSVVGYQVVGLHRAPSIMPSLGTSISVFISVYIHIYTHRDAYAHIHAHAYEYACTCTGDSLVAASMPSQSLMIS